MTSPVEAVAVTQADRGAAADLGVKLAWNPDMVQRVRDGSLDYWPSVQAFARHRLSAIPTPPPADHTDLIARLDKFLADLIDCPDFTEPAADGGITVAMVFQHDARWLRTKLARAQA